jgi:hypothetical protein
MSRIWHYVAAVVGYWQFWVAVAFMIERSMERFFPKRAAALNLLLPVEGRRKLFIGIAIVAFVYANFRAFDDVSSKLEEATRSNGAENRWSGLTSDEVKALRDQVRRLSPETITVACETINCRDLADGIADILADVPGWKVSKLHRGGLDITGVTGIRIEPHEPATENLQKAIESATKLKVDLVETTRAQMNSTETFMVVGTKPF